MHIIISNSSDKPIYEQITDNIKSMILSGELVSGEMLPSIRSLAKDLRISVITTKRAYEELEKDGFIETIPSKGCFVKNKNSDLLKEEVLKTVEEHLINGINVAKNFSIDAKELNEIINYLIKEVYDE